MLLLQKFSKKNETIDYKVYNSRNSTFSTFLATACIYPGPALPSGELGGYLGL